jgi:hypothetical protein
MNGLLTDQVRPDAAFRRSGRTVPRRPILSLRSSTSTSFMLASLRVLHVDLSHAQAMAAAIEERP